MSQTVLRSSSMQYQRRPPAVTSYCHCSIVWPDTSRVLRLPRSGCCRSDLALGFSVNLSQATREFAEAAEQTCSQPSTAALVPYRKSHPDVAGGGATRSRRFGKGQAALPGAGIERPSVDLTGCLSRLARPGWAWISAVARHSRTS
jgi:hypothetical protein